MGSKKNSTLEKADRDEDTEEEVPLVPIIPSGQQSLSIITVNGLEDVKIKALIAALKECEGVQTVLPQGGGRFGVEGSAPVHELVEAARKLGFEAEGKTEVIIDIPDTPKTVDPNHRKIQLIKATALICLILQNCSQALCMKYSTGPNIIGKDGLKYIATTAVVMGELVKLLVSCIIIAYTRGGLFGLAEEIWVEMINKPVECAKLLIPSLLYTLQNNLQFIALANISAAVFQVTSQLKILSTAVLTVAMLGRTLGPRAMYEQDKWGGLVVLTAGCIFVNLDAIGPSKGEIKTDIGAQILGIMCTLCLACTSGLAGVYFEKVLKGAKTSLWIRQIQLSVGGLAIGTFGAYANDGSKIVDNGFFQGYTSFVVFVILLNSLGGLLVALVVKYTDNIAKAFAVSISIILSSVVSVPLFGFTLSVLFIIGTVLVISSVFLYEALIPFDMRTNTILLALFITASSLIKL